MPTTYAIPDGRTVMAATLYTGTSATQVVSNAVNGVSFQPDFVWMKARNNANYHWLTNSVTGTGEYLSSNDTIAARTGVTDALTAFSSTGFTLGVNTSDAYVAAGVNYTGRTYVGWQWKAGTSSSITVGQYGGGVPSIASTVSANTTAGFSVVTYSANGSTGTVGHGLGVAPSMIIVKKRNAAERWCVFHTSISNAYIYLNEIFAAETANAQLRFGNNSSVVQPTSTVFTIGSANDVNGTSGTYVAYCFAAVAGYSAFGSYDGNSDPNGPFVYLGFRPRWLMIKRSSTASVTYGWQMYDTSRQPANTASSDPNLWADTAAQEGTGNYTFDLLSNGFKLRSSGVNENASGSTYIYAAFAENPFKYANAR